MELFQVDVSVAEITENCYKNANAQRFCYKIVCDNILCS